MKAGARGTRNLRTIAAASAIATEKRANRNLTIDERGANSLLILRANIHDLAAPGGKKTH